MPEASGCPRNVLPQGSFVHVSLAAYWTRMTCRASSACGGYNVQKRCYNKDSCLLNFLPATLLAPKERVLHFSHSLNQHRLPKKVSRNFFQKWDSKGEAPQGFDHVTFDVIVTYQERR
ncbi:hypothetical protein CEXT_151821 [Caerostris extrusa]|uniref:Uncharacterized protein n=1 Tax=Caerostris extrusa TaxID=172846 RepID=A0AAV4Y1W7_CAEEX|nr:hypothetical protein CEXT_151821 [Caerostris extrusa]